MFTILLFIALENSYRLEERLERTKHPTLAFIFDENNHRCVREEYYPFKGEDGQPMRRLRQWFVVIKNVSIKSADEVVVFAHHSWFVENTIAMARQFQATGQKSPVIFRRPTLEPGAEEVIELFGMSRTSDLSGDVFKQPREFVLKARARDVPTVRITLNYEPTEPFGTILASSRERGKFGPRVQTSVSRSSCLR